MLYSESFLKANYLCLSNCSYELFDVRTTEITFEVDFFNFVLDQISKIDLIFHFEIVLVASLKSDKGMTLKNDLFERQFLVDRELLQSSYEKKALFFEFRVMDQRIVRSVSKKLIFVMLRKIINI